MVEFPENRRADQKKIPVIEEQGRALMQAVPDLVSAWPGRQLYRHLFGGG